MQNVVAGTTIWSLTQLQPAHHAISHPEVGLTTNNSLEKALQGRGKVIAAAGSCQYGGRSNLMTGESRHWHCVITESELTSTDAPYQFDLRELNTGCRLGDIDPASRQFEMDLFDFSIDSECSVFLCLGRLDIAGSGKLLELSLVIPLNPTSHELSANFIPVNARRPRSIQHGSDPQTRELQMIKIS